MRDRARAGVDAGFSASLGVPRNRQIPWGETAPGRLGERRRKEAPARGT